MGVGGGMPTSNMVVMSKLVLSIKYKNIYIIALHKYWTYINPYARK